MSQRLDERLGDHVTYRRRRRLDILAGVHAAVDMRQVFQRLLASRW
jgi:hypothetical protein